MRVLLVLPDVDGLNLEHEAEWISRSFHTEILKGSVSIASLFEYIIGRQFDIVHFGGHGTDDGIALSGSALTMFDIERIARAVGAQLVYLNSCSSARLAQFAIDQGVPAVIATTADVPDSQAWSIATSFYQALLVHGDLYTAFEVAKPRDGTLSFYSDGQVISKHIRPLFDKMEEFETLWQQGQQRNAQIWTALVVTWIFMFIQLAAIILYGWGGAR